MIDRSKINIGGKQPAANLPVVLSNDEIESSFKRRYYDIETDTILPAEVIAERMHKNIDKARKITVETAADCYFIDEHQKELGIDDEWMENNVPISKQYRYDIRKVFKMLVENGGPRPFDELIRDAMNHFEAIGVGKLKLIAQIQDEEVKTAVLEDVKSGAEITAKEILKKNPKISAVGSPVSIEDKFHKEQWVTVDNKPLEIVLVDFEKQELELMDYKTKELFVRKMQQCTWFKK